jgi:hypothetical protein
MSLRPDTHASQSPPISFAFSRLVMSTAPSASLPASGTTAPNSDTTKLEHSNQKLQDLGSNKSDTQQVNWESELQLVSSLAKLQELERKVSFDARSTFIIVGTCFIFPLLLYRSNQLTSSRSMSYVNFCPRGF